MWNDKKINELKTLTGMCIHASFFLPEQNYVCRIKTYKQYLHNAYIEEDFEWFASALSQDASAV